MSHYSHKSMLDAKFVFGNCFSFGDMTSQIFPLKKGNHQIIEIPIFSHQENHQVIEIPIFSPRKLVKF